MPTASSPASPDFLLPSALAATISIPRSRSGGGPPWQYHSRSDHHSKVACLLMQLDLMLASPTLRSDVEEGRVACGINHVMQDHANHRKKAFDLVLHRPDALDRRSSTTSFKSLLTQYGVALTADQADRVAGLPDVPTRSVPANGVYVAFEAKAAMTAFSKARPRLFDELNSSHLTIHGDTANAVAAALVMINTAPTFVSPVINSGGPGPSATITSHRQPEDFVSVVRKVAELPRRSSVGMVGFDAVGVLAVNCANDGSRVDLVREDALRGKVPAADADLISNFAYGRMIQRVAYLYEGLPHRR